MSQIKVKDSIQILRRLQIDCLVQNSITTTSLIRHQRLICSIVFFIIREHFIRTLRLDLPKNKNKARILSASDQKFKKYPIPLSNSYFDGIRWAFHYLTDLWLDLLCYCTREKVVQ